MDSLRYGSTLMFIHTSSLPYDRPLTNANANVNAALETYGNAAMRVSWSYVNTIIVNKLRGRIDCGFSIFREGVYPRWRFGGRAGDMRITATPKFL